MGYTTSFDGRLVTSRKLTSQEETQLDKLKDIKPGMNKDLPASWCCWQYMDDEDGTGYIEWDGSEKFYNYFEWLRHIKEKYLDQWGVQLEGEITWGGENYMDCGAIVAEARVIHVAFASIDYENKRELGEFLDEVD